MKKLSYILVFVFFSMAVYSQGGSRISIGSYSGSSTSGADEITPNMFAGKGYNDVEKIQKALDTAVSLGRKLVISKNNDRSGQALWMIDSAILLNSDTYIVILNATLQLTNSSRDNMFRTSNTGFGLTNQSSNPRKNITITGIGEAILKGADNPRSTGDFYKTLSLSPDNSYTNSYGTDAGVVGQRQSGDWRNYMAIFAYSSNVTIDGLQIVNQHAYGLSFHRCKDIRVTNIKGDSKGYITVAGVVKRVYNQGLLDFNMSVQNLYVSNVSGVSHDDVVALNITPGSGAEGTYNSYYSGGDIFNAATDSVYNVRLNNITADTYTQNVRILCSGAAKMKYVYMNGIHQYREKTDAVMAAAGEVGVTNVMIGSTNATYGGVTPMGNISHVFISNLSTTSFYYNVKVDGTLADSYIKNYFRKVTNANPAVYAPAGAGAFSNVDY